MSKEEKKPLIEVIATFNEGKEQEMFNFVVTDEKILEDEVSMVVGILQALETSPMNDEDNKVSNLWKLDLCFYNYPEPLPKAVQDCLDNVNGMYFFGDWCEKDKPKTVKESLTSEWKLQWRKEEINYEEEIEEAIKEKKKYVRPKSYEEIRRKK